MHGSYYMHGFGTLRCVLVTKKLDHIWDLGVCPAPILAP